jgi:hypothetical protein
VNSKAVIYSKSHRGYWHQAAFQGEGSFTKKRENATVYDSQDLAFSALAHQVPAIYNFVCVVKLVKG